MWRKGMLLCCFWEYKLLAVHGEHTMELYKQSYPVIYPFHSWVSPGGKAEFKKTDATHHSAQQ